VYDFGHKLLFWITCVKSHNHILVGHVSNRRWSGNKMQGVSFHHFYFIYMASMIYDKMMWMSNSHYNVKKMTMSFDMTINKPTPTYWPTYLSTHPFTPYLPTYLHIYLPTNSPTYLLTYLLMLHSPIYLLLTYPPTHYSTFLPTYLPTHPPTYLLTHPHTYTHLPIYLLPTCLHACLPIHPPTDLLLPVSYNLLTILQLTYYLFHNLVMIWNKHVR
jgi:hypothetical protein